MSFYLVIILKTARLEYGLHPFFYSIKDQLRDIILVAQDFDPTVHFAPSKMARVRGSQSKIKITPSIHNAKIIFLKLYGHKVVQSFFLEFTNPSLAHLFWCKSLHLFTKECLE